MKHPSAIFILILLLFSGKAFSQKVRETSVGIGFNKLQSTVFRTYYDEECSPPTFLNLGVSQSWYQTNKRLTFNKEIGVNFQYSSLNLSSGGLGGHSNANFKLFNLFAEATIQAQLRIDSALSIGFGPTTEYLVAGYNETHSSYYLMLNPPTSGQYNHSGFNRNYFEKPRFGVRFSILNSILSERATIKIHLSYFRFKEDNSNFHSSSYIKVGLVAGFKHKSPKPEKK